jgi:hypothetical protein
LGIGPNISSEASPQTDQPRDFDTMPLVGLRRSFTGSPAE